MSPVCRYVLLIHTPRLCAEPLFLEGADKSLEPPSTIECQPVVSKLHETLSHGDLPASALEGTPAESSEPTRLENLIIQPPVHAIDSSHATDNGRSDTPLETDPSGQDHVETALLMTYNPETGEIESVESTILDLVEKGKQDKQEVRRRVFGTGRDEKTGHDGEEEEATKATITVDQLEEIVRSVSHFLHIRFHPVLIGDCIFSDGRLASERDERRYSTRRKIRIS